MNNNYISITALNKYLKYKFDEDEHLQMIYLKGEISNFKKHTRGHFYFTLKDENSRINAVMFSYNAKNINFNPMDGMTVLVSGKIAIYEATGSYQIYVEQMEEDGIGNLYVAFEKLKKQLDSEGLFNQKRPIAKIPRRVGIVTASTGAAIKDILTTIKRRYPLCETILFPSLVQGNLAASDIVKKIELANTYELDTLIIGRGGGSIEDLWPFNEEKVARAIYNSKIPTISAVGHEIDFTIADFVADLRAPTPTAAAELAVPDINNLNNYIDNTYSRSYKAIKNYIDNRKLRINKVKGSYIFAKPMAIYEVKQQKLDNMIEILNKDMKFLLDNKKIGLSKSLNNYILNNPHILFKYKIQNLNNIINNLELLNPLNTLKRGYTITKKDHKVINSISQIKTQDNLSIEFSDGKIETTVIKVGE